MRRGKPSIKQRDWADNAKHSKHLLKHMKPLGRAEVWSQVRFDAVDGIGVDFDGIECGKDRLHHERLIKRRVRVPSGVLEK